MAHFKLAAPFPPSCDQGHTIAKLTRSIQAGNRHQTLLEKGLAPK